MNPRYPSLMRRLAVLNSAANFVGAGLNIFYFSFIQSGSSSEPVDAGLGFGLAVGTIVLLLGVGNWLSGSYTGPMFRWYQNADVSGAGEPAPARIRQIALNTPLVSALTSLAMWVIAGLFFSFLSMAPAWNPGDQQTDWGLFASTVIGTAFVAGPITALLIYFANERMWRAELPYFFGGEELIKTPGFRLTMRGRLLALFGATAFPLLFLALLSYNQTRQIASSPEPETLLPRLLWLEVFMVLTGISISVVLATTLGASLVEALEKLGSHLLSVRAGKLGERMAVDSNDEMGMLASHFNFMTEGLNQRDIELKAIYAISQEISAGVDLNKTVQTLLEQTLRITPYEVARVCLFDEQMGTLRVHAQAAGGNVQFVEDGITCQKGQGFGGWLAEHKESLLVPDTSLRPAEENPFGAEYHEASYLGVPLESGSKLVGTLEVVRRPPEAYDEHSRQLLETIAPQAAIAIANAVEVLAREQRLKAQIAQLQIEIDQARRERQVAEITESDFFKDLQEKASELRRQAKADRDGKTAS